MLNRKASTKNCIKGLLSFMRPYRTKAIIALVMIVITQGAFALNPMVEGMITSQLTEDAIAIIDQVPGAHVHFDVIFRIMMILMGLYLLKTVSQLITTFFLTDAIQGTMHDLRNALQKKIQRLPVRYFDDHPFGDLLSKVTNDVDALSNALQQALTRVFGGILTFIFVITMMLRINIWMSVIALLIIPFSLIITKFVVGHSQRLFEKQQATLGELNGTITEMYGGFNEIILYGKQEDAIKRFEDVNERMCNASFKAQFVSSLIAPLISLCTYLAIGGVAVLGCIFVIQGVITVGNLQAFIRYIWQINEPLSSISQLSGQVQSAFAGMGRIFGMLEEEEEVLENPNPVVLHDVKGMVKFEHVQFGYDEELLMHDVNIDVKPGQMVAIVGPTGAGKTTLMNLLLRFYDVKGGAIKIDGVDIRDMPRESLRSLFSLVLQDTWLFNGSVYDNIRYGRRDARKDEVIEAAKMANVHHFIRTLSQGYDTQLNEEANNISQGEKQLLTIARAILKDPQILILDEATSSVDTRLEKMLQEAMQRVMANRTSFVIAHRLSTIKNADLILVLQHGNIIEQGTHESLLAKKGFYEKLYHSQFANQESA
ncbi:ABC transporter ATP-binding protein [Faecalicoccus acidiformans]|uniref:ABC transporter ATP-binding protein n=1 Tax=Faecalicoccus acidiformans TaxID=915173 RepID=UPI0025A324B0|nr:ABC transporter ATP-binding protein [Faecalicoccus acidiformans]MDM8204404.1 ABC transporter ATP-binding protein [Faecalicoccus acidiformans]